MKAFLSYLKPHTAGLVVYCLFTFMSILFGLVSLTLLIPFLSLLFGQTQLVHEPMAWALSTDALSHNFNYLLSSIIQEQGKPQALTFICLLVLSAILLKNLFFYGSAWIMSTIPYKVSEAVRNDLHAKVLALPIRFFSDRKKGDLMSRLTTDVVEVELSVFNSLYFIFREPVTIILYITALVAISPRLTLFILVLLPFLAIFINRIGQSLKRYATKGQAQTGAVSSHIEETLSGLRAIKAFGAEKFAQDRFIKENSRLRSLLTSAQRRRTLSGPVSEVLGVGVLLLVLFMGGKMVLSENPVLSAAAFIGYVGIFSQVIPPAKSFAGAYYSVLKGMGALNRIQEILSAPVPVVDHSKTITVQKLQQQIQFRDVSFAYGEQPVLSHVSFDLPKGKTIALVGPSGAGKSTLADLLLRFHDPRSGTILLDETPLSRIKKESLRSIMAVVPQEALLFHDTIYENIRFGMENVGPQEIESAARKANAHEFIEASPQGYQTVVGDRGGKLSGGQRQRISIARAILRDPEILILDEATSALDNESERLVQEALTQLMANRTTLVIAHRLSTIRYAHQILVMDQGRIVESGTHQELSTRKGLYQKLYELQAN